MKRWWKGHLRILPATFRRFVVWLGVKKRSGWGPADEVNLFLCIIVFEWNIFHYDIYDVKRRIEAKAGEGEAEAEREAEGEAEREGEGKGNGQGKRKWTPTAPPEPSAAAAAAPVLFRAPGRLENFGDVFQNEKYRLLELVIEGKIEGRCRPGRRDTSCLKNLQNWYGTDYVSLFRLAISKIQIALTIRRRHL